MARNIQDYINGLINKNKISYLDLNNNPTKQNNPNCSDCNQPLTGKIACNNCLKDKQLEGEITDLKELTNLRGINMANNQLTKLDFLTTLPNKDKLKSLNVFGNQIKEVDFAGLFTTFPNLEKINLAGNPVAAKNLNQLTNEQFTKLIDRIKDGKIKINSYKGTILMDLLAYAQELAEKGNTNSVAYLQTLIKQESSPTKPTKQPSNAPLLIGGLVIFGFSLLVIGYLWGKNKKSKELDE